MCQIALPDNFTEFCCYQSKSSYLTAFRSVFITSCNNGFSISIFYKLELSYLQAIFLWDRQYTLFAFRKGYCFAGRFFSQPENYKRRSNAAMPMIKKLYYSILKLQRTKKGENRS
jgi:hypothetical protein